MDEATFERNASLVKELLSKEDQVNRLDEFLENRASQMDNWAYRWWLEDMYLNNMIPLPVNSNPGWVFPRKNFEEKVENMLVHVVGIVQGMIKFKQSLERYTFHIVLIVFTRPPTLKAT